jgi:hypothetical protein
MISFDLRVWQKALDRPNLIQQRPFPLDGFARSAYVDVLGTVNPFEDNYYHPNTGL